MTPKQAFRYGFLLRCAEEGLTEAETADRIKTASVLLTTPPEQIKEANILAPIANTGMLGLIGSGLVGTSAGYAAAKLQEDDVNATDYRNQDLVNAYRQATEMLRTRAARRMQIKAAPVGPRLFAAQRKR